jgi:hypothetical protein
MPERITGRTRTIALIVRSGKAESSSSLVRQDLWSFIRRRRRRRLGDAWEAQSAHLLSHAPRTPHETHADGTRHRIRPANTEVRG